MNLRHSGDNWAHLLVYVWRRTSQDQQNQFEYSMGYWLWNLWARNGSFFWPILPPCRLLFQLFTASRQTVLLWRFCPRLLLYISGFLLSVHPCFRLQSSMYGSPWLVLTGQHLWLQHALLRGHHGAIHHEWSLCELFTCGGNYSECSFAHVQQLGNYWVVTTAY